MQQQVITASTVKGQPKLSSGFTNTCDAARDRGSADRYYGRRFNPHYEFSNGDRVWFTDMTKEEVAAYREGWDECTDSKDYGAPSRSQVVEFSEREFAK